MNSLILVAAGMGSRMGAPVNKLLLEHDGRSLISYTLSHVLESRQMDELILVVKDEERAFFEEILAPLSPKVLVKLAFISSMKILKKCWCTMGRVPL